MLRRFCAWRSVVFVLLEVRYTRVCVYVCVVEAHQRGVEGGSGCPDLLPGLPEDPEQPRSGPPPPG